jgi:hypothetical protein
MKVRLPCTKRESSVYMTRQLERAEQRSEYYYHTNRGHFFFLCGLTVFHASYSNREQFGWGTDEMDGDFLAVGEFTSAQSFQGSQISTDVTNSLFRSRQCDPPKRR